LGGATLILAPVGYLAMFSGFHAYDDEGSILITLRDYLSGHPLLTPNIPYYGPFFYETIGGLFKLLGVTPTNDSGRLLTLVFWLIASGLAAFAAYRLTRNLWITLVVQLVTFILLTALTREPMTVYGLLSLLMLGLVVAASFASTRPRAAAVAIGAILAALCLVKINVGAFAALAVVFAWAGGLAPRWRRFALPAMGVVVTVAPLLLMANLLARAWVLEFALVVSMSAAAVSLAWILAPPPQMTSPSSAWLILGGGTAAALSLAVALAGGTHVADIWNGLVVRSVQFSQLFTWPVDVNPVVVIGAAVSLAACVAYSRVRVSDSTADLVRIAAGLFILLSILLLPSSLWLLGLSLAWIATRARRDEPNQYVRLLLPALAVLESLHAYPVAGTQLSLAALLMIPVGAVVLNDGITGVTARRAARIGPIALIAATAVLVLEGFLAGSHYAAGSPSGLRGAELVRMPAKQGAQLRQLVAAIDSDCSGFITFPGMNSIYIWTGQEPPSDLRYGVWWLTPDPVDQQAVVGELEGRSRVCVVKNQNLIDFWAQGRQVPPQPVVDFIDASFMPLATFGDYEVLVRKP
jgi:hypothetical protein